MAPATVLVVDDDPVILKLLEVNFEMEGFEVVRAADGAEGLERARQLLPDIVILDVMMPRMTGYEVAKALREDGGTAHIPIIFVTARAQSTDVERGMELGVDDYVTKPFDPLDLIARVHRLLARRAAPAGANGEAAPPRDPVASAGGVSAPPGSPVPGAAGPAAPDALSEEQSAPESGVPESGVPESGVPESGVPESGVPESGVPESGVPESAVPESGSPTGDTSESRPL